MAKARRADIAERANKNAQIEARFLERYASARRVFIYVSHSTEVDTHGILSALIARGVDVFVPYTDEAFCLHAVQYGGQRLTPNALGNVTRAPAAFYDGQADVTVVPLCAFNEDGYRIGQGKGCYDRYFASFEGGERVGLAYDEQAFAFTPDSHDVPLDVVLTPTRVLKKGH